MELQALVKDADIAVRAVCELRDGLRGTAAGAMRNVQVTTERVRSLREQCFGVFSIDSPSSSAFLLLRDVSALVRYPLVDGVCEYGRFPIPEGTFGAGVADIVAMDYIPDLESICIVADNGDIVTVNVHGGDQGAVEVVGQIAGGVSVARWSPGHELLTICGRSVSSMLILTQQWDVLHEIAVDDVMSDLSWRSDGTSFIAVDTKHNLVVLYDRNGHAIARSDREAHDALLGPISFRPNGDFAIAPVLHDAGSSGAKTMMCLFEGANALRHGQFDIDIPEGCTLVSLDWNVDSSLFAIVTSSYIDVMRRSNYHWYCKIRLSTATPIVGAQWDPEDAMRLVFVTSSGLTTVTFHNDVTVAGSVAGVIDGSHVLLYPLQKCTMPPPLAYARAQCQDVISAIALSESSLACVLCDGSTLSVFDAIDQLEMGSTLSPSRTVDLGGPRRLRHLSWMADGRLVAVEAIEDGDDGLLIVDPCGNVSGCSVPSSPVVCVRDGAIQSSDGSVFRLLSDERIGAFPTACQTFSISGRRLLIGFDPRRSRLFVSGELISQQCTSTVVTDDGSRLLFTTSGLQNVLHIVDLLASPCIEVSQRPIERGALLVADVPDDKVVLQMPRGNLEVIHPIPLLMQTVGKLLGKRDWRSALLKMRRHRVDLNLIYDADPVAFDPEAFVNDVNEPLYITEFLGSVSDTNTRDTVYTSFKACQVVDDDDVDHAGLASLAVEVPGQGTPNAPEQSVAAPRSAGKVNFICDLIAKAIAKRPDAVRLVQPHMCALIRQQPPRLEEALRLVGSLGTMAQMTAMRFAITISSAEDLFSAALGTYDFALVEMVGRASQRDPREYGALLDDLRAMPTHMQRYNIDLRLGRHARALEHLATASPISVDLCIELIKSHPEELFPVAFRLFPSQHPALLTAYAEYSRSGAAWEAAGDDNRAMEAYREAGQWREAMTVAFRVGVDTSRLARDLAVTMTTGPVDEVAARNACHLYAEYCQDVGNAVSVLVRAELWADAILIARGRNRADLVGRVVGPAVDRCARDLHAELASNTQRLKYCANRLVAIRETAVDRVEDDDDEAFDERPQSEMSNLSAFTLTSQCSSVDSWASKPWSNISSVTRRLKQGSAPAAKQRRKARKMKEGDPREPAFLVKQLRLLAPRYGQVAALLQALLTFQRYEEARAIQSEFDAYLGRLATESVRLPDVFEGVLDDSAKWRVPFLAPLQESIRDAEKELPLDTIDEREDADEEAVLELF